MFPIYINQAMPIIPVAAEKSKNWQLRFESAMYTTLLEQNQSSGMHHL